MRIISGKFKGIRLTKPSKIYLRPTTDKAKEGLFNILANRYYFENKNVLDLFAGTGNISYEFASRGCESIFAVDNNYNCVKHIQETSLNIGFNISAIKSDGLEYLKQCTRKFDFIFADPPYNYQYYQNIKDIVFDKKLIKKNGCLIIEHNKQTIFKENETRKYGTVHFSIFSF